jgi:uncharacterized membrane protein YtjA (UPF0391 family)
MGPQRRTAYSGVIETATQHPSGDSGSPNGVREMLKWAVIFAVIALIAGGLGFSGVAAGAAGVAKILFVVFLVLFVAVLLFALLGAKAISNK